MSKAVAFVLSHALAIIVAAIFAILAYQHFADPKRDAERAKYDERLREKTVALALAHGETHAAEIKLDSALSALPAVVTKWRTATVHDTLRIPVTATPHDSVTALSTALTETRKAGDSVVRACTEIADSCKAFRAKATAELAAWSVRYAALDSLSRIKPRAKRLNLSLAVGFGYATPLDQLAPKRQAFVGLTIGRSLLSW